MGLFGIKKKDTESSEIPLQLPPMQDNPVNPMPPDMGQQGYGQGGYGPPQPGGAMNPPELAQPPGQMAMPPPQEQQSGAGLQQQPPQPPPQQPFPAAPEQNIAVEETVEAIIDEKWNELLKDINKIVEWKERTDSTIIKLKQEVEDLRNGLDSLHKAMLSKISAYDQNIKNVGVDIKAMEQVFQKILPKFTDNVNKLSRITDRVSGK